jgi:hypothetical protein
MGLWLSMGGAEAPVGIIDLGQGGTQPPMPNRNLSLSEKFKGGLRYSFRLQRQV